jgi:hypothetical protein
MNKSINYPYPGSYFSYPQISNKKIFILFGTLHFRLRGRGPYELTGIFRNGQWIYGRLMLEYYLQFLLQSTFGIGVMGGAGFLRNRDKKNNSSEVRTSIIMAGEDSFITRAWGKVCSLFIRGGVTYLMFQTKDIQGQNIDFATIRYHTKGMKVNYMRARCDYC